MSTEGVSNRSQVMWLLAEVLIRANPSCWSSLHVFLGLCSLFYGIGGKEETREPRESRAFSGEGLRSPVSSLSLGLVRKVGCGLISWVGSTTVHSRQWEC